MPKELLRVEDLHTYFSTYAGLAKAVDGVSFSVDSGEMVGVVGESGCGKSVMAKSLMRLIPDPPGRIVHGRISFTGLDIMDLTEKQMQKIRGNDISMIFQEPMTSLNPTHTVGAQLCEVFTLHQGLTKKEALEGAVSLLKMVGIPSPAARVKEYPFQMSGGMRQRVMIAMALACRPKIILADEPTTALDVTIQAQVLELIGQLQKELQTSMILITHDLGVIAETVKRVLVMYTGKVVEQASVEELFNNPLHPYTRGLMESLPSLETEENRHTGVLKEISGVVPDLCRLPPGCSFFPRCPQMKDICQVEAPKLIKTGKNHFVRCWLYD
ncbi:MAG: ABC transporter ATP-binding protein [Deltaproteobacteria bacterium]|nr:ABC transporter ATP-binding protein [Deltaproteobacteria bacterium]